MFSCNGSVTHSIIKSMNGSKNLEAASRVLRGTGTSGVRQNTMKKANESLLITGKLFSKVRLCANSFSKAHTYSIKDLHGNGTKTHRSITCISTSQVNRILTGRTRKSEMRFGTLCASGLIVDRMDSACANF